MVSADTPKEQQMGFARRDLQAIANVVSEEQYIVGKRLTVFDFSVASLLAGLLDNKPATWLTTLAGDYPALTEYAERVQGDLNIYCRHV